MMNHVERITKIIKKTSMLSFCDYSDVFMLVKGTITVAKETNEEPNNANKKSII